MALQNQTSRNQNSFFFATQEDGEQTLTTSSVPSGSLTDFYVGITGAQGNQVQINQMADIIGTSSVGGEQMLYAGTASTYKTLSSIMSPATAVGSCISIDRIPGSGLTAIESYASNGAFKGFEFLSRGIDSALQSTPMDSYMSTIGAPGSVAKLGGNGSLVAGLTVTGSQMTSLSVPDTGAGGVGCLTIQDLSGGNPYARWSWVKNGATSGGNAGSDLSLASYNDAGTFIGTALTATRSLAKVTTINQYNYPQAVVSVPPSVISPGAVAVPNATPTIVLTIPSVVGLVPGLNYLTDINISLQATNPSANPVWLQVGVRLGGNGGFNYENPLYVPPGGIPIILAFSLNQISDMGSSTTNIDIVAYQQSLAPGTTINVTATTSSGSPPHLLKNIT